MKTCPACRRELPLADFNFKNRARGRRQVYCRVCSRAYVRDHYHRNQRYYIDKALSQKGHYLERVHGRVLEYLREHPCVDCNERDVAVLDFDHLDRATKVDNVGDMITGRRSWRTILREIEKCAVRCSNCHRRRTAQQFHWYRLSPEQPGARSSTG
jgi:hypothetical protein